MAIRNEDIYDKAIVLFDEPKITIAYQTNKIQFYKLMYPFLRDSYALLTNPQKIAQELATTVVLPIGQTEIFEGDGETQVFKLSINPQSNSLFEYKINGKVVDGKYNEETNEVDFGQKIEKGKECSFEFYCAGGFTTDLSVTNNSATNSSVKLQVEDILCRMLVRAWAESKRNFALDIQNILTDTDFKLHPQSAALRSKIEWCKKLENEISLIQNKLATNIRFSQVSNWGRRVW